MIPNSNTVVIDFPDNKVGLIDRESMNLASTIEELSCEQIRCAILFNSENEKHVLFGCTNGLLLRIDPSSWQVTLRIKLKKHIFCML
jgi:hypothetical protein